MARSRRQSRSTPDERPETPRSSLAGARRSRPGPLAKNFGRASTASTIVIETKIGVFQHNRRRAADGRTAENGEVADVAGCHRRLDIPPRDAPRKALSRNVHQRRLLSGRGGALLPVASGPRLHVARQRISKGCDFPDGIRVEARQIGSNSKLPSPPRFILKTAMRGLTAWAIPTIRSASRRSIERPIYSSVISSGLYGSVFHGVSFCLKGMAKRYSPS